MRSILVTIVMGALTLSASLQAQENGDGSDERQAYLAEIATEREAADVEMLDRHWSALALTDLVLLKAETVTIGSGADDSVVLEGPKVAAHHAEVVSEVVDGVVRHTIRAVAGPLFTESNTDEEIAELVLDNNSPRLRVGRNIVYYQNSRFLGPMIRVLDYGSSAYTLFKGLEYFPVDPSYRVEATIDPYDQPTPIKIVDTMGFVSPAWVYGMAEFTLKGKPSRLKLILFTPDPTPESIFYVMYGDKTNGRETYGAGRYLLPGFVPSGKITLDFNRSVNPSCAYNAGSACPMPPAGNRFAFPVSAGIKDYAHRPST